MDFTGAFNNKSILIPILQRDYVQGSTESVIVPFLDSLLYSDCDLNFIYGYDENGCFVPVDGQQRLITLWLLHLYVYNRKKNPNEQFNVELTFQAREYASAFCSRLCKKLRELLSHIDESKFLDNEIRNQNWFISSWNKNVTVTNMLNTLRYIHKKINTDNIDAIYDRLFVGTSPVSFAFLDMTEENGLDDDIYIKMNGRGRPLSAFENLKSWMDQYIEELSIADEWKGYMDNRWTNLFWKNRNQAQEHPEEIDDEQLHMFCNLLVLFHVRNQSILLDSLSETSFRDELIEYLELDDEFISDEAIYNKILSNLSKGKMMPLVWLERLHMMPAEFFNFAFKSLNLLSDRFKDINDSGLYFGGAELEPDQREKTTRLYELSMTDSSFGRTLPLLYAIICFKNGSKTTLYDWLRVSRNLILNRDSKEGEVNANLKNVMVCIENFANKVHTDNIFDYLSKRTDIGTDASHFAEMSNILSAFSNQQIQEEILKSKPEMRPYHEYFAMLENLRFFSGRIKALFNILPEGGLDADSIRSTINLLCLIFNGGDKGITGRFDDENHYLRRILMSYQPFWYGFEQNKYWSFCNGLDDWRRYIRSQSPDALIAFVRDYAPENLDEDCLYEAIKEKVENISQKYLTSISIISEDSFKHHFIHHPGVWDYMNTKLAIWGDNPYDIVLKKSNSNNSNRFELRTYCLYLDYYHSDNLKAQYQDKGWMIGRWEKGDTCFYLQRDDKMTDGEHHTLAIDVLFRGVDGKRDSENCYALSVFIRTSDDENEADINNSLLLPGYNELFDKLGIKQDARSGRFVNQKNLSRAEIIETLSVLLSSL